MENIATQILIGIIIAAASSWITVQLSLKKFYKEKNWQRKADAYTKIIEALHDIKAVKVIHESRLIGDNSMSKEEYEKSWERYDIANKEFLKFKDIGTFVFPEKAVSLLNECHNKLKEANKYSDDGDYVAHCGAMYEATEACLENLIKVANKDLKK